MAKARTAPTTAAKRTKPTKAAGTEPSSKPWWQRGWAIASAVIAIIGAITGVIGVWPLIFRDATKLDSLVLTVESADSQLAPVYAVPVDADWASFPVSSSVCDPGQLAWLQANGQLLTERFIVSVANTADEGSLMTLKEFRGVGDVVVGPPTHVAVLCDQTGAGPSELRAAALDPGAGSVAVYQQNDPSLPDNPLVFTLAPGENGQFVLTVRSSVGFTGKVSFVSAVGVDTRDVELPTEVLDLPGVAPIGFVVRDGMLACEISDCDPAAVLARLS